ncbi:MAG: protein YgfX [Gammaproteobacteria bacterium]
MSNPFDTPLRFRLDAVRSYQGWYLLLHLAAAALLLLATALAPGIKMFVLVLLLISLAWQWHRLARLPSLLIQEQDLDWVLEDQRQRRTSARLLPECYVARCVIVLQFRLTTGKRQPLVILPHMLDRTSFRRLGVYLRFTHQGRFMDE